MTDWPSHLQSEEQFAAYITGKTDFDVFPEERARPAFEDEQKILQTGEPLLDKLESTKTPKIRNILSNVQIEIISPRGNSTVSFRNFTTIGTQVIIIFNESI